MKRISRVKQFTKLIDMMDDEICNCPNKCELSINLMKDKMIESCKELIKCLESGDNYWLVIEPEDNDELMKLIIELDIFRDCYKKVFKEQTEDTPRYITLEDFKGLSEKCYEYVNKSR